MSELTKPSTLNKIWGATNLVTAPSDGKISTGWSVEIPTWEDFQWLDNRQDQFIAYLNQHGIPEWDSTTEYQTSRSYIMGSNGLIYRCILTHTNKNPVTDPLTTTYWVIAFNSAGYAYSKSESDTKYLVKASNLSDLSSIATARTNLGLGTASTLNTGTTAGQVMTVGSFGVGSVSTPASIPSADCNSITATGFYGGTSSTTNKPTITGTVFTLIHITYDANNSTQFVQDVHSANSFFGRTKVAGVWNAWGKNYNSTLVSSVINTFMGSSDAATARTNLGVGSTGALAGTAFMNTGITAWGDASTARTGLGIGTVATESVLPVAKGGTGATTAASARTNLGVGLSGTYGYTPVNKAGDTLSGILVSLVNNPALFAGTYGSANLQAQTSDGSNPSVGWHMGGIVAKAMYLASSGQLRTRDNSNVDALVWTGADASFFISTNGYHKLPSGLIIQWGLATASTTGSSATNSVTFTFPLSFPNTCLQAFSSFTTPQGGCSTGVASFTNSSANVQYANLSGQTLSLQSRVFAIGY